MHMVGCWASGGSRGRSWRLGRVRYHADSRWNVTCFCLTGNSLHLELDLRVFLGIPGVGKAHFFESAQNGERGQTGKDKKSLGNRSYTRTSMSIQCLVCAFLHLPLTGFKQLMALKNFQFCHLSSNAGSAIY